MTATIAVIGLGYVGLPLATAFGRKQPTIGFDVSRRKIESYRRSVDPMGDVSGKDFESAGQLSFTDDPNDLAEADYLIVAVPTPLDRMHQPDLQPLILASETVGRHMKSGATVIYESTVYPGCTEEVCVPILERESGMAWKKDFFVAYSPERINPGDKLHRLETVVKVVAGDTPDTLERVAGIYEKIVEAGVHRVEGIQIGEAAKVIENTQRDLNIALMNELAIIFNRMGIDTNQVLEAAGTKWNFLHFRPGLVGGHCIGVDPYYLTYKAEMLGYHPHVILAGRRINDQMGKYVAEQTVKQVIAGGSNVKGARISILGMTFKENIPDIRNSRVIDIIEELRSYGVEVHVHDPVANPEEVEEEYGVTLTSWEDLPQSEALIFAVAHDEYQRMSPETIMAKLNKPGILIDVKSMLPQEPYLKAGYRVWRL